jgi:hypothetical protein
MSFNPPKNPLEYPVNSPDPIKIYKANRAPTPADNNNFNIRDFWIDESANHLYFCTAVGAAGATWILLSSSGLGSVATLTGNIGGAISPDGAGDIAIVGAPPISVSGNPATNTLTIDTNGTVATQFTADTGTAAPTGDNLDILGGTGIATSGATDTITIEVTPTVPLSVGSDSGTATPALNTFSIVGAGSVTTSATGATLTITDNGLTATTFSCDSGSAIPTSNNLNVFGGTGIQTIGTASTLEIFSITDDSYFVAYLDTTASNVTGNNTIYTVIPNNTIVDINSDYNPATGVFTAPANGVYAFTGAWALSGVNSANTTGWLGFYYNSSIRYFTSLQNFANARDALDRYNGSHSIVLRMSAGDTLVMQINIGGSGSANVSMSAADPYFTYFMGGIMRQLY